MNVITSVGWAHDTPNMGDLWVEWTKRTGSGNVTYVCLCSCVITTVSFALLTWSILWLTTTSTTIRTWRVVYCYQTGERSVFVRVVFAVNIR